MGKKQQQEIFSAVRRLMRPLVRILLRNGVAYGALAEVIRKVYVDIAFEDFSPAGKKQTVSRVSGLTGLTRKEVKRLLETEQTDTASGQQRYNRAVRVIGGWVKDRRFQDAGGKPADLPVEGVRKSFALLVKGYSGDIPHRAMFNMLEEAGSVKLVKGRVRLVRRAYVPGGDATGKIRILGTDAAELISTIDHNLTAEPDELLFQRKVSYDNVDPESLAKLKRLSFKKAQALLEQLDRQYASNELDEDGEGGKTISMGIYFYEKDSSRE
jgi:hypothetical protein